MNEASGEASSLLLAYHCLGMGSTTLARHAGHCVFVPANNLKYFRITKLSIVETLTVVCILLANLR